MTPRNPLSAAVFAGTLSLALGIPAVAHAADGFVEGSKVTLNARNFYINRNFVDPAYNVRTRLKSGPRVSFLMLSPATPQAPSVLVLMCWPVWQSSSTAVAVPMELACFRLTALVLIATLRMTSVG